MDKNASLEQLESKSSYQRRKAPIPVEQKELLKVDRSFWEKEKISMEVEERNKKAIELKATQEKAWKEEELKKREAERQRQCKECRKVCTSRCGRCGHCDKCISGTLHPCPANNNECGHMICDECTKMCKNCNAKGCEECIDFRECKHKNCCYGSIKSHCGKCFDGKEHDVEKCEDCSNEYCDICFCEWAWGMGDCDLCDIRFAKSTGQWSGCTCSPSCRAWNPEDCENQSDSE